MTHDPGFDDPVFDHPGADDSPVTSHELEVIKADLAAVGMPADEAKAWLADAGPDGAVQWYRSMRRANVAFQNARARRQVLQAERARNAPVDQLASDVVAGDVVAHGSGGRLEKTVVIVDMIPGSSMLRWFGINLVLISIAVTFATLGYRLNVPSASSGQPTGPVEVTRTQAQPVQSQPKLTIAPGTQVDFTFDHLANSTCPPNSIASGFGAGYSLTLNPDGSLNFRHQASSPLAPDLIGTSNGATLTATGQNDIEKLSINGAVDRLVNPTSLSGKAAVSFPGANCGGDFDASATFAGSPGTTVAPEPRKPAVAGTFSRDPIPPMRPANSGGPMLAFAAMILAGAAFAAAATRRALAWEPGSADAIDVDEGEGPEEPEEEGKPHDFRSRGGLGFDPVPAEAEEPPRVELK